MTNYSPTDTIHATIDLPDNGEKANANNLNTAVKDASDNAQVALNALTHYTSQVSNSRGITDGSKRLHCVTDLTALLALTVGAGDDNTIRAVLGPAADRGIYQYDHGAFGAGAVDGRNSFAAAGSTGLWRLLGRRGMAPPLESWTDFSIDANGDEEGDLAELADETEYQDLTVPIKTDIPQTLIGDVFETEICLLASLTAGGTNAASGRGIITLFMGNNTDPLIAIHSVILSPGGPLVPITLKGRAVSIDEGDFTVKVQAKTNDPASTTVNLQIFSPVNAVIRRFRE
jgi:hypothetical protein